MRISGDPNLGSRLHPTVSVPLRHGLGGYALALGGQVFWRYVLPALPALTPQGPERRLLATADTCLPCYVWPLEVPVTSR